jgi:hypothetical protein
MFIPIIIFTVDFFEILHFYLSSSIVFVDHEMYTKIPEDDGNYKKEK